MNRCTSRIALYDEPTRCELDAGHHGEHETEQWGPRICWRVGLTDVRSAA